MLGLATKPEQFASFTPVAEFKETESAAYAPDKANAKLSIHPIGKAKHQGQANYYKNDTANLGQVHSPTIPYLCAISRGQLALKAGGIC